MTPEELEIAHNVAKAFHETYERLAPSYGYKTREVSAVPWDDVPEQNKMLMVGVVGDLLDKGIIYDSEFPERVIAGIKKVGRGSD